jgi:hypothetical protein
MKVVFEGKCTGVVMHKDGTFASNITWDRGKWSNESVYIDAKLELGQRVNITIDTNLVIEPLPHANDCASWVSEPCNCVVGQPDKE